MKISPEKLQKRWGTVRRLYLAFFSVEEICQKIPRSWGFTGDKIRRRAREKNWDAVLKMIEKEAVDTINSLVSKTLQEKLDLAAERAVDAALKATEAYLENRLTKDDRLVINTVIKQAWPKEGSRGPEVVPGFVIDVEHKATP